MARLESTKRAKLKSAKQHQPSQKSKSLTCCYLLPRFWVTPYLVPIGTVDMKKKVSIQKLFLSFPNKGGCSYADMHWYALICCQYIVDTANLEQNPGGTALLSCPLNVTLLPRCPEHESHIPTFELDSFGSRCRLANPPTRELPQPFTWKPTFLKSEKSDLQIVSWNSNDSSLNQKWYANGVWLLFDVDAIAGTSLWFL